MELIQFYHTPTKEELNSSIYITWAGHRICSPDHRIGPRILQNYKIILILKGRGWLVQEDIKFDLTAGDIFVLFPDVKHLYYTDPTCPWEIMWVSFNGNICNQIMQSMHLQPDNPVIVNSSSPKIIDLFKGIIDFLDCKNEPNALSSTGYLYLLFSKMLDINLQNDNTVESISNKGIIEKCLTFIDLNYYNNINVDLLCKHVNYSRSYLSRLFKENTDLSIPEYINQVRMQKAKLLLKNTELNISEVAKSVGFVDPFYFSKTFKKFTGVPPANYKSEISVEHIKRNNP